MRHQSTRNCLVGPRPRERYGQPSVHPSHDHERCVFPLQGKGGISAHAEGVSGSRTGMEGWGGEAAKRF